MPRLTDDFVPASGLDGPHPQTLYGVLSRPALMLPVERRRLETPDHDFLDVDVLPGSGGGPQVVLLHGLEGSSSSGYILQMMAGCQARGWTAWALNARSCGGEPNRQAASYSSGDFRDLAFLIARLSGQASSKVAAVGFSLGGSVTLNLLGKARPEGVAAAAAVSTPFRLAECAQYIDSSAAFARVYRRNFLPTMKDKALEKAARFPERLDAEAIRAAQTIRDFDHAVTAPTFGFASAEDYYAQCSSAPLLSRITTPTLLVSSEDDPLAPAGQLPADAAENEALHLLVTTRGGHVGFIGGSVLRPSFWAEARVLGWLDEQLG
jgi:hypothetical protein